MGRGYAGGGHKGPANEPEWEGEVDVRWKWYSGSEFGDGIVSFLPILLFAATVYSKLRTRLGMGCNVGRC